MTSTPASIAAPAAGAAPATPATVTTAPAAGSSDFLLLLAQFVGASVPEVTAAGDQAGNVSLLEGDADADEEAGPEDLLALFSPLVPVEARASALALPAAATDLSLERALGQKSSGLAADAQLLTDLIQAEQAGSGEPVLEFDSVQLPGSITEPQLSRAAAAESPTRPVHTPVGNAAWADEIGTRVVTLVEQGKHVASLRLSPEHLGPLEINISMKDNQASVWFGAAHADTRAAIETALPRLRELFESQGLSLSDAGVFREPPREEAPRQARTSASAEGTASNEEASTALAARIRLGLVDAYA